MHHPALALGLLLAQLGATFYMIGLCWFVQRVHYPLFGRVGSLEFETYEREHVARTGPVVAPVMGIELAAALAWIPLAPAPVDARLSWLGLGLLAVVWGSTAFVQVPCHRKLASGFDPHTHRRLVRSNWVRTAAWSLRGAVLGVVFWQATGQP